MRRVSWKNLKIMNVCLALLSLAAVVIAGVFVFNLFNLNKQEASIKRFTAAEVPSLSTPALSIDEYMKAYESKGRFSGAVLAAKGDTIVISRGYGMADFELGVQNTTETKFHLGSLTKQFTAMAIMQLEEKGILSVNDTLSKYIKDYPDGDKITIHQLLTHTSGIPDYINDDETFAGIARLYHPLEEIIARFKYKPLEFKPGTQYDYSNSGYVLLSYIIQKVSGKKYDEYLKDNIFKTLGMDNTGYDDTKPLIKNRARGYLISSNRLLNADFFDRANLIGADGLYSTVVDLYTWDRALYTEKLVSKKTLDRIFSTYPPANNYGYGWTVNNEEISHYGLMDGYFTCIYRNIEDETVIIILSNIQDAPVRTICRDIYSILHDKEYRFPEELQAVDYTAEN